MWSVLSFYKKKIECIPKKVKKQKNSEAGLFVFFLFLIKFNANVDV